MNMLAQHEFYDPAEAQRLETVYQAGYIDEEEYQRRRAELVQTFATPLQTHAFLYSVIAKKVADYMGIDMQTEDRAFVLSVHSAAIQGIFNGLNSLLCRQGRLFPPSHLTRPRRREVAGRSENGAGRTL